MGSLYVVSPDARVHIRSGRLVVADADDRVFAGAALDRLGELVIVGRSGITVAALHALLDRGVTLVLLNYAGRPVGRLERPLGKNHPRRRALYRRADDAAFCLAFSRAVVAAKVGNSRSLALRWSRGLRADGIEMASAVLDVVASDDLLDRVEAAPDLATLRGIEGQVARSYYLVLRAMLRQGWLFPRRSRRPPRDPANALLSILYSLLTQACVSALEIAGLDPFEGLFHADKHGRPALALDLMEEFRGYVADSAMLRLVNRRMIDPDDFDTVDGGTVLQPKGWRVVMAQFGKRMNEEILDRRLGRRVTIRALIEHQARRIAALVDGREAEYRPFRVR